MLYLWSELCRAGKLHICGLKSVEQANCISVVWSLWSRQTAYLWSEVCGAGKLHICGLNTVKKRNCVPVVWNPWGRWTAHKSGDAVLWDMWGPAKRLIVDLVFWKAGLNSSCYKLCSGIEMQRRVHIQKDLLVLSVFKRMRTANYEILIWVVGRKEKSYTEFSTYSQKNKDYIFYYRACNLSCRWQAEITQ
jgi:hypothetical protein